MKTCLVLEGGAMRGMFTAGVLDVLYENNIDIDCIIGVSAGALFGVNYFSKQPGRVIRYSKRFCNNCRYISKLSLVFTGNIVNKNFAYYKVTKKLDKFDDETFKKSNKKYYATVTNLTTGNAEYIPISSVMDSLEVLRASSSIPLVSKNVLLNDSLYLDGAISDSIPVKKALELGYDKIIVVLTRDKAYVKDKISLKEEKLIRRKYKKYPNFINAMVNRSDMYNNEVNYVNELEDKNKVFVVRPSKEINVNLIERNEDKLQEIYDLGTLDMNNLIGELKKYLTKN